MKLKIIFIWLFCNAANVAIAQDIITFRENGSELKTKVLEISDVTIKYKKWDNLDGPIYTIPISTISRIKYKNGKEDVFDLKTNLNTEPQTSNAVQDNSSINNYSSAPGYPKVPLVNIPYLVNNTGIIELEPAEFKVNKQSSGAWGRMYVKSISGLSSNVRFSKKDNLKFIIQLDNPKTNPSSICELDYCEIKGQRQFIESKKGVHGVEKQDGISIVFEKLNDTGLYIITLPKNISSGEYFFSISNQSDVYAFGIDK